MKTRAVVVSEYERPEGAHCSTPYEIKEKFVGKFHQFGLNVMEYDDCCASFSTAIVEDSEGRIHNVQCELIRFLDVEVKS